MIQPQSEISNSQLSDISYRKLFECSPDGILVLNAEDGKIIESNSAILALLALPRAEISGRQLWEIGFFKGQEENFSAFRELEKKSFLRFQNRQFRNKAGEFFEFEITLNFYSDDYIQLIQCGVRDITERNTLEFKTNNQESAFLAQIASRTARLGGWTIDLPDYTLTWSDENCAIHEVPAGYKPTLEEGINYFPPEYRDQVIRYVESCAKDGIHYDFELPKFTAKGRLIWVRSIGEAVRNADGKITRLQGAFQDITEQKQAEAEREKLIEELQQALAEVKRLREFLPICSYCKKIRDDENYWQQIDNYISLHTNTKFSHGICPECYEVEDKPEIEKLQRKF